MLDLVIDTFWLSSFTYMQIHSILISVHVSVVFCCLLGVTCELPAI